jgi:hypothetical protein
MLLMDRRKLRLAAVAGVVALLAAVGYWGLRSISSGGEAVSSSPASPEPGLTNPSGLWSTELGSGPAGFLRPQAPVAKRGDTPAPAGGDPERSRLLAEIAEAEASYGALRMRLMRETPDASHYFGEAERLRRLADGMIDTKTKDLVRSYFSSGTLEEREQKQALFEHLKDLFLVTEIYQIGTSEATGEIYYFAYDNGVVADRIIVEREWTEAIDALVGFDATGDAGAPPVRNSAELLLVQLERRLGAVEDYVEHEARLAGMPEEVVEAAREQLRAEVLAEMSEAFAARSAITEARTIDAVIDGLRAQLGNL